MITFADVEHFIRSFFFGTPEVYPLALSRIAIGVILFFQNLELYEASPRYFSSRGILGYVHDKGRDLNFTMFKFFGADERWIRFCFGAGVLFSAFLTVGFLSQISALVLAVLAISRVNFNALVESGGNSVPRAILFLMTFAPIDAAFSVDAWLNIGLSSHWDFLMQNWAIRVMQIQICLIYVFSLSFKFTCGGWFTRDAVLSCFYTYYGKKEFSPPAWIRFPLTSAIATAGTVFLQGTFPIAVWIDGLRLPYLAAMAGLHISMAAQFFLWYFTPCILACLLLFVQPLVTAAGLPAATGHTNSPAEFFLLFAFASSCLMTMIAYGGPSTQLSNRMRALSLFKPFQWLGMFTCPWQMFATRYQFYFIPRHELHFRKGDEHFIEMPIHFYERQVCAYLHREAVFDCWINYALRRHPGYEVTAVLAIYQVPKLSGGWFTYNRDLKPRLLERRVLWQSAPPAVTEIPESPVSPQPMPGIAASA